MADLLLRSGPTALRRSPLTHLEDRFTTGSAVPDRAVSLTEVPFLTMVSIRVAPGSAAAARIGELLGVPLPTATGQTSADATTATLWLAPDEWLLLSRRDAADVVPPLRDALGDDRGAVVDVSANRTALELRGPWARSVLEKGCPADLHPRSFAPGRAITTTLGPVPLLLWRQDPASYLLLPRSSFADYVARWLLDAMGEYAGPEVP